MVCPQTQAEGAAEMSDCNSPAATKAVNELEEELSRFARERHLTAGPAIRRLFAELYLAATYRAANEAAAAALPDDVEPDALTRAQRAHFNGLVRHAEALHDWVDLCRTALGFGEDADAQHINRLLDGML
jgi:hypothetical protein